VARALITGIGGQDGAYLARLLLDSGYRVLGTSRDVAARDFAALRELGLEGRVELRSMTPDDPASVRDTLDWAEPDEVYALSSQSSVSLSFERPAETRASIVGAVHTLLEAVRQRGRGERVFHASSSECFGNLAGRPADEETPFNPLSPYGLAKAEAHALVARYRAAHGLFAVNGVMFNHESPLRPERFVTRKIAAAAARIAGGSGERLRLGNLDVVRDWGWAPDYVDAMWRMLQVEQPDDFVIATGQSHSLAEFASAAFAAAGLDWRDHVEVDPALLRAADLMWSAGRPDKALERLGWRAAMDFAGVAQAMTAAEVASHSSTLI